MINATDLDLDDDAPLLLFQQRSRSLKPACVRITMPTPLHPPVGLPRDKPCLSFWLANARNENLSDHRTPGTLPEEADVVIIGSGMSGVALAYFLMTGPDPPQNVVMLEARQICSGATGRNGGHCRPDSYFGYSAPVRTLRPPLL